MKMKSKTKTKQAGPCGRGKQAVPPAKLLLTVRDCANLTSLSEKTILRLIKGGKLHCLSSIRHKRVPASDNGH